MRRTQITIGLALLLIITAGTTPAVAQRPEAARLLPATAVVFAQVRNVPEATVAFQKTWLGRMLQDPQLRPLAESLYGNVVEAAKPLNENLGISLSELLAMPSGEIAFAVVPRVDHTPAIALICDVDERAVAFQKLVDEGVKLAEANSATRENVTIGDTKIEILNLPGARGREVAWFVKDGTLLATNQREFTQELLVAWTGSQDAAEPRLADHGRFVATMDAAASLGGLPDVAGFVNPIELIRAVGGSNTGAQVFLALMPALGLDGIGGIGVTASMAREQFDAIVQGHLWLDSPRSGALEVIALRPGDVTPERHIPADAARYTTLRWDFRRTFDKLLMLVDSFRGEGAFLQMVAGVMKPTGLELEMDILAQLDGRVSFATVIEQPITLASQGQLAIVHLKDGPAFQKTFEKLVELAGERAVKEAYGTQNFYRLIPPEQFQKALGPAADEQEANRRMPAVCLLDHVAILSDRTWLLQAALRGATAEETLGDALDYKLIASWAQRRAPEGKPGLFTFDRPEEAMRMVYDLAVGPVLQERLQQASEKQMFMKNVRQSFENNPPPPFEALKPYFAPGGAVLVDDETGLHYTYFLLRRE